MVIILSTILIVFIQIGSMATCYLVMYTILAQCIGHWNNISYLFSKASFLNLQRKIKVVSAYPWRNFHIKTTRYLQSRLVHNISKLMTNRFCLTYLVMWIQSSWISQTFIWVFVLIVFPSLTSYNSRALHNLWKCKRVFCHSYFRIPIPVL